MKKFLSVLMLTAIFALGLVSCGSSKDPLAGKIYKNGDECIVFVDGGLFHWVCEETETGFYDYDKENEIVTCYLPGTDYCEDFSYNKKNDEITTQSGTRRASGAIFTAAAKVNPKTPVTGKSYSYSQTPAYYTYSFYPNGTVVKTFGSEGYGTITPDTYIYVKDEKSIYLGNDIIKYDAKNDRFEGIDTSTEKIETLLPVAGKKFKTVIQGLDFRLIFSKDKICATKFGNDVVMAMYSKTDDGITLVQTGDTDIYQEGLTVTYNEKGKYIFIKELDLRLDEEINDKPFSDILVSEFDDSCPSLQRKLSLRKSRMNGKDVAKIQQELLDYGFNVIGEADGWFGPNSEKGVKKFQCYTGCTISGIFDDFANYALFNNTQAGKELRSMIMSVNSFDGNGYTEKSLDGDSEYNNSFTATGYYDGKDLIVLKAARTDGDAVYSYIECYKFVDNFKYILSYTENNGVLGNAAIYVIKDNREYKVVQGHLIPTVIDDYYRDIITKGFGYKL